MAENTAIEWATHSFNGWVGCQAASPACGQCYAEAMDARFNGGVAVHWGPGAPRKRTSAGNWNKPLAWNRAATEFIAKHGYRPRVFSASMSDVFDNAVDPQWRVDLLRLISSTPNLDWLLLTKRIGNAHRMLNEALKELSSGLTRWENAPWPNVWIGATVANQEEADRDIPKLLSLPAKLHWLSIEPMLGPIDLAQFLLRSAQPFGGAALGSFDGQSQGIDWVIAGGESGRGNPRPLHPDWPRLLRDQCSAALVPYFFKQWGEWAPAVRKTGPDGALLRIEGHPPFTNDPPWFTFPDGQQCAKIGKRAAGRLLDGVLHHAFPFRGVPPTTAGALVYA